MNIHTFHIPVMGIAFSIDTPLKVAHKGIDSVISIIEDSLLEKVRKVYSEKYNLPFTPIEEKEPDSRANRVTSYLNMVKQICDDKFNRFKATCSVQDAINYFKLLPNQSIKKRFFDLSTHNKSDIINYTKDHARMGSIDVNIMTKIDKTNYQKGKPLPRIFNDAHASLRGYARSNLNSSLVLSAGLNPALFTYMEEFEDFYPDKNFALNKKIILKVSDYRSALIQGKFLAKKGLWISEFRIESGLNCGGHAFGTEGFLMGPILETFKQNKHELRQLMFEEWTTALQSKGRPLPGEMPKLKITAQGGVGTAEEHSFLLNNYCLDGVGWGSPFLLVPEVTCLDDKTRKLVRDAGENDLYLSDISPLGIPFHNLKNNTQDIQKEKLISKEKPGSPCVKKFLSFNTEFTEKPICTASAKFQRHKIKELQNKKLTGEEYAQQYKKITAKSCLCTGLGTSFLISNNLDTRLEGDGVSICPGPNIAYFDKILSLENMVDHIYGRKDVLAKKDRPHMFIKELNLYMDRFREILDTFLTNHNPQDKKRLIKFVSNMKDGINYYKSLVESSRAFSRRQQVEILHVLNHTENNLCSKLKIEAITY